MSLHFWAWFQSPRIDLNFGNQWHMFCCGTCDSQRKVVVGGRRWLTKRTKNWPAHSSYVRVSNCTQLPH